MGMPEQGGSTGQGSGARPPVGDCHLGREPLHSAFLLSLQQTDCPGGCVAQGHSWKGLGMERYPETDRQEGETRRTKARAGQRRQRPTAVC